MNFYGKSFTINILKDIVKTNKVSHAYLFYGENGVGKKTIAKFFAKAILCGKENAPCGICLNCVKFETNNHPDFVMVGEKDYVGQSFDVNCVRDLIKDCFLKPNEAFFKVFVLNCVDSLLLSSANALLKILEEPPQNVIFLLTANSQHNVLKTIWSRCMRFFIAPVTLYECFSCLQDFNVKEDVDVLKETARLSLGKIGLAKFYLTDTGKEVLLESLKLFNAYLKGDEFLFISILQKKEKYLSFILETIKCFLNRILIFFEDKENLKFNEALAILKKLEFCEEAVKNLKNGSNVSLTLAKLCCKIFNYC